MAKLTLEDLGNITGQETSAISSINANNAATETALENTLSRDGTSPNEMNANLDMNTYNILNVGSIQAESLTINGSDVSAFNEWLGDWTTSTAYEVGHLVENDGSSYICLEDHTSGTFATDLAASKWDLVAQKGDTGVTGANGSDGADGVVQSIVAGTGISVDDTDPANPIVSGGVTDGDKGDITVSASGATWSIDTSVISTFWRTVTSIASAAASWITLQVLGHLSTRTALKALTPTNGMTVYLSESGREGNFTFSNADLSTVVALDTAEGVYVAPDSDATGASGAWVRERNSRELRVEWFGATEGGAVNNSSILTAAIALAENESGGRIYIGGYYRLVTGIVIDSDDIELIGTTRSSGLYSDTAAKQLVKFTGSRQAARGLLFNMPVFTSTTSDYTLWLENVVQFVLEDCRVQGGYNCMTITGGACADNRFVGNAFLYATGREMVYIADSTGGVNGAHHFYRCLFNQPYATATPNGTNNFKGTRANTTAYSLNDVVVVGNYYLQCSVAGTSGGSAPTVNVWYGVNITDGTVTWRLLGMTTYSGIRFDTNVYYCTVRECDFTAPFTQAIRLSNTLSGDVPNDIHIEQCTCHGPINVGIYIEAGRQIDIRGFECWNPTDEDTTSYGILQSGGNDIRITDCELFGFDYGVYLGAQNCLVQGCTITGNTTGVQVAAGVINFRILGNNCGSTARWGANTNSIVVASGASDYYVIAHNNVVGAGAGVSDSGSGSNKTVSGNH